MTRSEKANRIAEYVDREGNVVAVDYFYDPELSWRQLKNGAWVLHGQFGGLPPDAGSPTPEWLARNPKP